MSLYTQPGSALPAALDQGAAATVAVAAAAGAEVLLEGAACATRREASRGCAHLLRLDSLPPSPLLDFLRDLDLLRLLSFAPIIAAAASPLAFNGDRLRPRLLSLPPSFFLLREEAPPGLLGGLDPPLPLPLTEPRTEPASDPPSGRRPMLYCLPREARQSHSLLTSQLPTAQTPFILLWFAILLRTVL